MKFAADVRTNAPEGDKVQNLALAGGQARWDVEIIGVALGGIVQAHCKDERAFVDRGRPHREIYLGGRAVGATDPPMSEGLAGRDA